MKSTYKFHFVNVSDLLQYEDFKAVIAIPFVINIGPLISNFETYLDRYLHPNLVLALVYSLEKIILPDPLMDGIVHYQHINAAIHFSNIDFTHFHFF